MESDAGQGRAGSSRPRFHSGPWNLIPRGCPGGAGDTWEEMDVGLGSSIWSAEEAARENMSHWAEDRALGKIKI